MSTDIVPTPTPRNTLIINPIVRGDTRILQIMLSNLDAEVNEALAAGESMTVAILQAGAMQAIRNAMSDDMIALFAKLMNSPHGFRTDRDPAVIDWKTKQPQEPYGLERMTDIVVLALVQGFRLTGNEFNIIANNFYATKEGMRRKLNQLPGLTHLRMIVGNPVIIATGNQSKDKNDKTHTIAACTCRASWRFNGVEDGIECKLEKLGDDTLDGRISIRVNYGMGTDAVKGKATAKLQKLVWAAVTGTAIDDVDSTDPAESNALIDAPREDLPPSPVAEPKSVEPPATPMAELPKAFDVPPVGEDCKTLARQMMSAKDKAAVSRLLMDAGQMNQDEQSILTWWSKKQNERLDDAK